MHGSAHAACRRGNEKAGPEVRLFAVIAGCDLADQSSN
jgi:hypothetical protein